MKMWMTRFYRSLMRLGIQRTNIDSLSGIVRAIVIVTVDWQYHHQAIMGPVGGFDPQ